MIDYKWMITKNDTAMTVKNHWDKKDTKKFLYTFIYLCKIGFTENELRGFVDELLSDGDTEDR